MSATTAAAPREALIWRIRERVRRQLREYFLWERCYARLRQPKRRGSIAPTTAEEEEIAAELARKGLAVEGISVDVSDFRRWLQRAQPIYDAHRYRGPYFAEKALEHYLAAKLLGLNSSTSYLDAASASSPAPEIYAALYGAPVLRQDLAYPQGRHGQIIGGDAADLPLPDASLHAMALHCSFEHFEGDSDGCFVAEAARVLRPGGRLCIVPLYLAQEYAIQTDPAAWNAADMEFENDAVVYCERGFGNRFGRFYSVKKFMQRVAARAPEMRLTLFFVENAIEVDPVCYLRFAAVWERG